MLFYRTNYAKYVTIFALRSLKWMFSLRAMDGNPSWMDLLDG